MKNNTVSLSTFINDYCKVLDLSEFTDTFLQGISSTLASSLVSLGMLHQWSIGKCHWCRCGDIW